jgi:hypothetical protein
VPALYSERDFAEAGGLMSYGPNIPEFYRQLGNYAGRILSGQKPGDLPDPPNAVGHRRRGDPVAGADYQLAAMRANAPRPCRARPDAPNHQIGAPAESSGTDSALAFDRSLAAK